MSLNLGVVGFSFNINVRRLVGFDPGIEYNLKLTVLIPKSTIKVNSLYYKYNAIEAVVYYIPQSILASFPINIQVFTDHRFLA